MKKLIIAATIIASFTATAGKGRFDRSVTQHKEFALQSTFDFACKINEGSATLIDPYWVVTADHAAHSKKSQNANYLTCYSYEKDDKGRFIETKQYASSDPANNFGEYEFPLKVRGFGDFSLVRLDTPIRNIKPAKLPEKGMFDYSQTYQVNQIGFGNYNGRNGGTKEVVFSEYENRWLAEYSYMPEVLKPTDMNWLTIHGDSGSGITIEKDGEFYLIGEIGLQYSTSEIGGWTDTFDDVIGKVDWIKEKMKTQGFSYIEEVELNKVRWTSKSPVNSIDYHAFFSYWKAENFDFNETKWLDNGGLIATAFATTGLRYSIDFVVPKNVNTPVFDLIVDGRTVAVNVDVNSAESDSLRITVNSFELKGEQLKVEFIPVGSLQGKKNIVLDYLAIKEVT